MGFIGIIKGGATFVYMMKGRHILKSLGTSFLENQDSGKRHNLGKTLLLPRFVLADTPKNMSDDNVLAAIEKLVSLFCTSNHYFDFYSYSISLYVEKKYRQNGNATENRQQVLVIICFIIAAHCIFQQQSWFCKFTIVPADDYVLLWGKLIFSA